MIPYAKLRPGPGFQVRRAALYYLQRIVTPPFVRRVLSWLIALAVRGRQGGPPCWPLDRWTRDALTSLRAEGVTMLPLLAPREQVTQMAEYFSGQRLLGQGDAAGSDALPAGTPSACYSLETILACPGLLALINSPRILRVAADYLGCKPTLSSLGVRWTFPQGDNSARFQDYHRDVDDWRFLKLFIYLTDVDEGSGPHVYARGSHRTAFGLRAKTYTQQELERRFGRERVTPIIGPLGTAFMADTLGIHRGGRGSIRPRLMLQVQYSLLPVFAFAYAPLSASLAGLDNYCNRLLVRATSA